MWNNSPARQIAIPSCQINPTPLLLPKKPIMFPLLLLSSLFFSFMSLASAVSPSPLNATGDSHGIWSCTLSASYFNNQAGAPLVRFADCGQTLSELLADVTDFGDQYFEWSSWGTPFFPRRRGPREGRGTPKKYVYGMFDLFLSKVNLPSTMGLAAGCMGGNQGYMLCPISGLVKERETVGKPCGDVFRFPFLCV